MLPLRCTPCPLQHAIFHTSLKNPIAACIGYKCIVYISQRDSCISTMCQPTPVSLTSCKVNLPWQYSNVKDVVGCHRTHCQETHTHTCTRINATLTQSCPCTKLIRRRQLWLHLICKTTFIAWPQAMFSRGLSSHHTLRVSKRTAAVDLMRSTAYSNVS